MPRLPLDTIRILKGDAIPANSVKTYSSLFPLGGEGWHVLRITAKHTVVIGTGTGAIPLSEYGIIKNITFKTSKNDLPHFSPAKGFYYFNYLFNGVEPQHTAMAAASAVYDAVIDIPFAMPFLARKEDLVLDTGRYNLVELELTVGGVADLFTTVGTSSVATTIDISVLRTRTTLEQAGKPFFCPYIRHLAPFTPTTQPYANIESANDLVLFGFFAVAHASAVPGVAFSGTPSDFLDDITFRDNLLDYLKAAPLQFFQEERRQYSNASILGVYPYCFVRDGSYRSGYFTGQRSEIKFEIGSIIGSPATPQVDLMLFGMRDLKE